MKRSWFLRGLAVLSCVLALCGGCRRKRPPADPSSVPPSTSTEPQTPVPNLPSTAQPKVGQAMPPMTTEMMLKFEARFGRPPTNYSELTRLQSEPPRK